MTRIEKQAPLVRIGITRSSSRIKRENLTARVVVQRVPGVSVARSGFGGEMFDYDNGMDYNNAFDYDYRTAVGGAGGEAPRIRIKKVTT